MTFGNKNRRKIEKANLVRSNRTVKVIHLTMRNHTYSWAGQCFPITTRRQSAVDLHNNKVRKICRVRLFNMEWYTFCFYRAFSLRRLLLKDSLHEVAEGGLSLCIIIIKSIFYSFWRWPLTRTPEKRLKTKAEYANWHRLRCIYTVKPPSDITNSLP